jgi:hypothetical protein
MKVIKTFVNPWVPQAIWLHFQQTHLLIFVFGQEVRHGVQVIDLVVYYIVITMIK